MNKNSVKKTNSLGKLFGHTFLILVAAVIMCGDMFAQDYQMTLNPRRLGHQIGVEV